MTVNLFSTNSLDLFHSEAVNGLLLVPVMRAKHYAGEIRTVGSVGEVLALEANSRASSESCTAATFISVCPVVRIYLYTWLCGVHLHSASAVRLLNACGKTQLAFLTLVEHEAMVVAGTVLNLLVVSVNILSDRFRGAEVEWSSSHFPNLSRRNACLVDGEIEVGIDLAHQVVDGWGGVGRSCQREESVVREVDDSFLVG